ncbi:MAG: PIN domain-containing protein [Pseudonocardiales bacterium]
MTRGRTAVRGLTLDAGALIAIDRGDEDIRALLRRARAHEWPIVIPAGALAQAWRGGSRQARLADFLRARRDRPTLHPLDAAVARTAGELCGRTGTTDVIDASVVLCARSHGYHAVTSDPGDLIRLDGTVPLVIV